MNVAVLWGCAAGLAVLYVLLFVLARRPVSLRPRRLSWLALAALAVRLGLVPLGCPLAMPLDIALAGLAALFAVGLVLPDRLWLLRTEAGVLREQIESACRGLFLKCTEGTPGCFTLSARTGTWQVRTVRLSERLQVVVLPRAGGPGKLALLLAWLSKQYPGPVPRLHINLYKE